MHIPLGVQVVDFFIFYWGVSLQVGSLLVYVVESECNTVQIYASDANKKEETRYNTFDS